MKEISGEIWLWMILAREITVDQHELYCTDCGGFLRTVTGEITLFLGGTHADHLCSTSCALSQCFSVSPRIQAVWRPCALSQPLTWQTHSTWNPYLGSSGCGFGHRSVFNAANFLTFSCHPSCPTSFKCGISARGRKCRLMKSRSRNLKSQWFRSHYEKNKLIVNLMCLLLGIYGGSNRLSGSVVHIRKHFNTFLDWLT